MINLVIHLYKNAKIVKDIPKQISLLKTRKFTSIGNKEESPRDYKEILGGLIDSKYKEEFLGQSTLSRKWSIELDMSGCLNLILSSLCGATLYDVRKMKDFEFVSRAILSLDLDNLDIPLHNLCGLSNKLDEYLRRHVIDNTCLEAVRNITNDLLSTQNRILFYIGLTLQQELDFTVIRSVSLSKLLLQSSFEPKLDKLIVVSEETGESVKIPFLIKRNGGSIK